MRNLCLRCGAILVLFLGSLSGLVANEAESTQDSTQKVTLEKSVVSAQVLMSEEAIELQPKQITIIEKDMLLTKGNGNIQSILESAPGIVYSRSGGINGQITFRGQNSNNSRSIVMIDGVRYTGRNTLELNMLDPFAFESVEIIRGPASSLWGSDAMNGVINFRSRKSTYNLDSDTFSATARIRALEYASVNNLFGGRLEVLGGGGGWDMLIGLGAKSAQDYTTPIKENGSNKAKNSKFNYIGLDFNIGYTNSNATRFYMQGRYTRTASYRAGGLGAAPGSSYGIYMRENPISEYYLRFGAKKHNLSFADSMEGYLYYRHWDTDIWNERTAFNSTYIHQKVYNNNYFGGRLIFNAIKGKHNLAYGAEFESSISPTQVRQIDQTNKVTNTTNRPSTNTNIAIFLKDDYKANDAWYLSGSVRGDYVLTTISKKRSSYEINNAESTRLLDDKNIIHQGAITGAIGSVLFLGDYVSNVINLSHNFKAPGAGSRMSTTPSGSSTLTVANPLIKPEYSQTAEFGFRFQSENHYASIIGFYTYYRDMLALSSYQSATITNTRSNTYRYENIGKAVITGVELEGHHSFFDDILTIRYVGSYNYSENKVTHKPIAYVAPLYGQISIGLNFNSWYLSWTQRGYGSKNRIDSSEERKTKAYTMSDVQVGLKLGSFSKSMQDMQLIAGVNNVFNTIGRNPVTALNVDRAEALTNPLVEPGRNIYVKYVWNY